MSNAEGETNYDLYSQDTILARGLTLAGYPGIVIDSQVMVSDSDTLNKAAKIDEQLKRFVIWGVIDATSTPHPDRIFGLIEGISTFHAFYPQAGLEYPMDDLTDEERTDYLQQFYLRSLLRYHQFKLTDRGIYPEQITPSGEQDYLQESGVKPIDSSDLYFLTAGLIRIITDMIPSLKPPTTPDQR